MGNILLTYGLVKSLFDVGEDYIDSFTPLVLKALESGLLSDIKSIQEGLEREYSTKMPIHVVGTVISRARKRKLLSLEDDLRNYRLTDKGTRYLESLETEQEVNRRLNALLDDLVEFFRFNGIPHNRQEIYDILTNFISINLKPLIEWLNPSVADEIQVKHLTGEQFILIEYLYQAETSKPEEYITLRDLILGSIISAVLYTESASDMLELTQQRFRECRVFLDSNFIISLLDVDSKVERNRPATELLELLKRCKFNIRVFDFTLHEVASVLGAYLNEAYYYPTSVKVDGIVARLKRDGWTRTSLYEYVANLPETLNRLGISVQPAVDINVNTYEPEDPRIRAKMKQYKELQNTYPQNHDLAAIDMIRKYRGKSIMQIERCKAIFLTEDTKLSRFNFIEMGHRKNNTVSEVIQDRLLTNILWLKNPNSTLPLTSIMAAYSRNLFISRKVWKRFFEVLAKLRQQKKVKDENISMLFYHQNVEVSLRELTDSDEDLVTEEFVLEQVEKSAKLIEQDKERINAEKEAAEILAQEREKQLAQGFEKVLSVKEQEVGEIRDEQRKHLDMLIEVVKRTSESSQRLANRLVCGSRIGIALAVIGTAAYCLFTKDWATLGLISQICSIVALVLFVIIESVSKLWRRLYGCLFNRIYSNRIKSIGLNSFISEE